jgi:predicted RNA methylase
MNLKRVWQRIKTRLGMSSLGYKVHKDGVIQNDLVFLQDMGLLPEHRILDIGCGGGRLGIPLINYLNPEGYFAFDKDLDMLNAFRIAVALQGLDAKKLPSNN